jgi:ERCC4-type nuclease
MRLKMSSKFLLSPSEVDLSEKLEDEAITSSLPEEKGADVLLYTDSGLLGWQRKKVPNDFISSVTDGRFARLLPLLTKGCTFCRIIQEGNFKYWPDQTVHLGMMRDKKGKHARIPSRFTRKQVHGILNDIEVVWGVPIRVTEDIDDTVRYLLSMRDFMTAKKHTGLHTRPKVKGAWYVPTAEETQLWLLQGFNGIGAKTADKIIHHFGRIPLRWSCTPPELAQIEGISLKEAQSWVDTLCQLPKHSAGGEMEVKKAQTTESEFDSLRQQLRIYKYVI